MCVCYLHAFIFNNKKKRPNLKPTWVYQLLDQLGLKSIVKFCMKWCLNSALTGKLCNRPSGVRPVLCWCAAGKTAWPPQPTHLRKHHAAHSLYHHNWSYRIRKYLLLLFPTQRNLEPVLSDLMVVLKEKYNQARREREGPHQKPH